MNIPQAGRHFRIQTDYARLPFGYPPEKSPADRNALSVMATSTNQIRISLVPRRGTISLAVGETYGSKRQGKNSSDPEGVE